MWGLHRLRRLAPLVFRAAVSLIRDSFDSVDTVFERVAGRDCIVCFDSVAVFCREPAC